MDFNKEIGNIIEDNMMEYSQYIIKNRSLPCIYSGLKPIHSKILWTMYEDNISKFTKSETVAGRVMAYSPHGSCYETIVNMVQKDRNLYPLIEGQGNFGSFCSNELMYASSRYTECKLSDLALDCMRGIDKNMVEMIDNYDNSKKMPQYIPVRFPQVLTMSHSGIAVGMASNTPSFNLEDVCNLTMDIILGKTPNPICPDFATGGYLVDNKNSILDINTKGIGSIELRAKYKKEGNTIIIYEIPYNSKVFVETIIDKIIDLIKCGKIKEITNVLNQGGYKGLSIEIECKKGVDLDKLMTKLYALTPLSSKFSCNMNVLVNKSPKVLGVFDIIKEWIVFRRECVRRGVRHDLGAKSSKLHFLKGLEKVILDIDKCISVIRNSEENEILTTLMSVFKIDENQAKEIATMQLRNINKKYILKQIKNIDDLKNEVRNLEYTLSNEELINNLIISDLQEIKSKYSKPRQTEILYESEIATTITKQDLIEDYNCRILYTSEGYIKKHLKQSENHKLKEEDFILGDITSTNKSTLLIFTNKANRYRLPVHELETVTPSSYGIYIKNIIDLEEDEQIIKIVSIEKEIGNMCFVFDNGKIAKIGIKSYMSANKKLQNCYNTESNLIAIEYIENDVDVLMVSSEGKALIVNTDRFAAKGSRNSQGNVAIKLDDNLTCIGATISITQDNNFKITTAKGKKIMFMLSDVAPTNKPNEERTLFTYLQGRNGNTGNFVVNTRVSSDSVTEYKTI